MEIYTINEAQELLPSLNIYELINKVQTRRTSEGELCFDKSTIDKIVAKRVETGAQKIGETMSARVETNRLAALAAKGESNA